MKYLKNLKYCILTLLLILLTLGWESQAIAATIQQRMEQFPDWQQKAAVQPARGDLEYPQWISGTWNVESTLVEQFAPLAPEIVSPGFEDNNDYLNQAIAFRVRFGTEYFVFPTGLASKLKSALRSASQAMVVADRAFNGKNIAQAYLGENNVYQVKIDPQNPNQQITFLRGERKLITKVTGRIAETPSDREFMATEVTQQLFRSPERLYLNQVETTSDYRLVDSEHIIAEQITAIYLSPQDPDYFTAGDQPIALYRYHLTMNKQQHLQDYP